MPVEGICWPVEGVEVLGKGVGLGIEGTGLELPLLQATSTRKRDEARIFMPCASRQTSRPRLTPLSVKRGLRAMKQSMVGVLPRKYDSRSFAPLRTPFFVCLDRVDHAIILHEPDRSHRVRNDT